MNNKLPSGKLTPRSNDTVTAVRYTGSFGQPDGFGSILAAAVRTDGRLVLTCHFRSIDNTPHVWTIELDNAQRNHLAAWIGKYQPTFFEDIKQETPA